MSPLELLTAHLREPAELFFPHMELLASDHEPPVVVGEGRFRIVSETRFEYEIRGHAPDIAHTFQAINRLRGERYNGLNRFRLVMRDADGVEWIGGWTIPVADMPDDRWLFTGNCETLSTDIKSEPRKGFSEARFLIPRGHLASLMFNRFLHTPGQDRRAPLQRVVPVQGVPVTFSFNQRQSVLTLTAPFEAPLTAPFAENWLGEPLRIMFGQLIYPRLQARHFDDGRSMISLLPSPGWSPNSDWLAHWIGDDRETNATGFFETYAGLLTVIAQSENFEAHPVTDYFVHAIQAERSSRWVSAMTMASSVEGLLRLLVPRETPRTDMKTDDLQRLADHIDTWDGPADIKEAAKSRVTSMVELSAPRALNDLVAAGVGTKAEVKSWGKVRNKVMHGVLTSPYSSQEDDVILVNLANLMRALTKEIIRRAKGVADPPTGVDAEIKDDNAPPGAET